MGPYKPYYWVDEFIPIIWKYWDFRPDRTFVEFWSQIFLVFRNWLRDTPHPYSDKHGRCARMFFRRANPSWARGTSYAVASFPFSCFGRKRSVHWVLPPTCSIGASDYFPFGTVTAWGQFPKYAKEIGPIISIDHWKVHSFKGIFKQEPLAVTP